MRTVLVAALAAFACAVSADPIDDFILAQMKAQNIPGMTLAVVRDGKVVRTGAYGKADLELDVPTNVDNVYEIGSITKQFTAILALQQMEEGKLSLDDTIDKYIEGSPELWKKITIRNLLHHNSGLKEYVVIPGLMLHEEFDQKTFLDKVKPLELDFETGATYAYSNTNFALLGVILEKVSGKSYTELINERILKPLEMTSTRVLDPDAIINNRAHGYINMQGQQFRTRQSMLSNISDGALLSTVKDMAKYDAALHGGKLLKPESYQMLITPGRVNSGRPKTYAMGTMREALGGKTFIGHHGNSPGYSAGYGHWPTAKLSVIVMGNVYAFNGNSMVTQIAELLEPSLKADVPTVSKPDPDKSRTDRVKAALAELGKNNPDEQYLEVEVTAPMKTDRGRMPPGPYAVLRNVESIEFIDDEAREGDRLLTYKLVTPARDFIARIIWSPSSKIADIVLRPAGPPKPPKNPA